MIMKATKLILFAIIICLSSCSFPRQMFSTTVDLTKYADQNFIIIEGTEVGQAYKPLGIVIAEVYSGHEVVNSAKRETTTPFSRRSDDIYGTSAPAVSTGKYVRASLAEGIDLLYQEALKKKANAIINLKYQYVNATKTTQDGWRVTGMAVELQN